MGAWGVGIFSDDDACDVRDDYRSYLEEGWSGPEATNALLDQYRADVEQDPDFAAIFWLALGATQWKLGRLEDEVRLRAIQVIDSGASLRRWEEEPDLHRKRLNVEQKLRQQLESPQRAPVRVKRRWPVLFPWSEGDYLSYSLRDGNKIVFRVIGTRTEMREVMPIAVVLNWIGRDVPTVPELDRIPIRIKPWPEEWAHMLGEEPPAWAIGPTGKKKDDPSDRLEVVGRSSVPIDIPEGWTRTILWSEVETDIAEDIRAAHASIDIGVVDP